ncbi:hypothetical protein CEUSTIGMA_g1966.t1 [Chlamydomonas eustigma]|uniref:Uncharacterized protein n=1 Tax=Chlamydomonas eustigma TaxID=1157962 RepID=A0A250WUL5_9CHLO|nr:hypothetical protein CEUSTIGMA_g1966.t1 [Chlamydomonas eustigma]|eukprot:GAX74517.1 hypothetical protein CEUSTIGMA_g1966.t1 [Chlamydomonas eustigma]
MVAISPPKIKSDLIVRLLSHVAGMSPELPASLNILGLTSPLEVVLAVCVASPLGLEVLQQPPVLHMIVTEHRALLAIIAEDEDSAEKLEDHLALMYNMSSSAAEAVRSSNLDVQDVGQLISISRRVASSAATVHADNRAYPPGLRRKMCRDLKEWVGLSPEIALDAAETVLQRLTPNELWERRKQELGCGQQRKVFGVLLKVLQVDQDVGHALRGLAMAAQLAYAERILSTYRGEASQDRALCLAVYFGVYDSNKNKGES